MMPGLSPNRSGRKGRSIGFRRTYVWRSDGCARVSLESPLTAGYFVEGAVITAPPGGITSGRSRRRRRTSRLQSRWKMRILCCPLCCPTSRPSMSPALHP